MKERIHAFDYAAEITKALPEGILLNTNGDKFNSMVIGWGHLGVIWGMPTFTVYVRQAAGKQLDNQNYYLVPLAENSARGVQSAEHSRDGMWTESACLTLGCGANHPPASRGAVTLECKVLYRELVWPTSGPVRSVITQEPSGSHTAYIGRS